MFNFGNASLTFTEQGKTESLTITGMSCCHQKVTIRPVRRHLRCGELLSIILTSETPVTLEEFYLEADLDKPGTILANGFQSWSQTREYGVHQAIPALFGPARPLLKSYGDYHITKAQGKAGCFHSWSWTGFNTKGSWLLVASTAEDNGYTLFEADLPRGKLTIRRECEGQVTDNYPLLQIYIGRGGEREVWDEYASLLPSPQEAAKCTGWTSWYNYYTKIDEYIIHANLQALERTGHPFQVFQIDDGWQEQIGDWLDVNSKFPSGMAALAQAIRTKGFQPGLWLAPFVCTTKSKNWRENYDWVLKDERGRPIKAGWNPGWNGWFYALDFYAPGFQTWLKEAFTIILKQWGFQMVKLDFLYAAALRANSGRCRGRVMAEAMDFLRQICEDKQILGCGVPLAQCTGQVEYCRIGADVAPYWEDRFLKAVGYRERVSTKNSLYSTLHRHMLDRRLFRNDPDVFILRDGKAGVNANKLNPEQRFTLFFLNNLLGGLVFFSDHVGEYTEEQKKLLAEMFPTQEAKITDFSHEDDLYTIEFQVLGRDYLAISNLNSWPVRPSLPQGHWFHPDLFVLAESRNFQLEPYQTICLVKDQRSPGPRILGSSGHIFPGAQVAQFTQASEGWTLRLHPDSAPHSRIWIALHDQAAQLQVNGLIYPARSQDGITYVLV